MTNKDHAGTYYFFPKSGVLWIGDILLKPQREGVWFVNTHLPHLKSKAAVPLQWGSETFQRLLLLLCLTIVISNYIGDDTAADTGR